MADQTPLVRQWLLLKLLSSRHQGMTVREMAAETGVTEKTVRRDLELFRQVGFPLDETVSDHGRKSWRVGTGGARLDLSFALDEALSLYLGRRLLEPLAGTLLWEGAQSAFKKIRACLGKPALDYLQKMTANFHQTTVGAGDYSRKGDLVDQLMQGIEDCKTTIIVYQSQRATEPVTYEVNPFGIIYHRGSLYLVAHSRDHAQVRHFKVDRIEEASVGPFPFNRPADFNLSNHFAGSFGVFHGAGDFAIQIKFLPAVARYVAESKWHDSQRLTKQKDGSLLAEFRLSSTQEIKRWVMSFGANAVVFAPEELRREILADLRVLLENYRPHNVTKKSLLRAPEAADGSELELSE